MRSLSIIIFGGLLTLLVLGCLQSRREYEAGVEAVESIVDGGIESALEAVDPPGEDEAVDTAPLKGAPPLRDTPVSVDSSDPAPSQVEILDTLSEIVLDLRICDSNGDNHPEHDCGGLRDSMEGPISELSEHHSLDYPYLAGAWFNLVEAHAKASDPLLEANKDEYDKAMDTLEKSWYAMRDELYALF